MVIFTFGGCCKVGCIMDRRIDDGSINVSIVMATSHILYHNQGTVMGFLPTRLN